MPIRSYKKRMPYYHVAPSQFREEIKANGLRGADRVDTTPGVYLWDSLDSAEDYRGDKDEPHDIWEVNPRNPVEPDEQWGQYGAYRTGPVDSSDIRRVAAISRRLGQWKETRIL